MNHLRRPDSSASSQAIPGPRSMFGWRMNMLRFYRQPFLFSRWLYEKYGQVVALGHGNQPAFVFAFGPELNQQILTNPELFNVSTALLKVPEESLLGRMFYNNLLLMTGEKHKKHRRLMQPSFHRQQIASYCNDMIQLTQSLSESWQGKLEIELNLEMKKLTQRIAVKTLFGLYNEEDLDQMGALIQRLTRMMPLISMAPVKFPGSPYHQALHSAEQLHGHIQEMITEKRLSPNSMDVLASLIQARDEDGAQLSDDELIGHAFSLYVAGHETSANALTWSLFLLSQHPHVAHNLMEEIDDKLGGADPTIEKLGSLSYLDAVVKETLRLMPPAGIGIRVTSDACILGGYMIPRNTNVMFNQMITHRIPELYEDPDHFKPERWSSIKRTAFEYLPFSAGEHMCIGWNFALQEIKVVLAVLLQRHRFSVRPNANISPNMMMRPLHGLPMEVVPQDRKFKRTPVRGTVHHLIHF